MEGERFLFIPLRVRQRTWKDRGTNLWGKTIQLKGTSLNLEASCLNDKGGMEIKEGQPHKWLTPELK